MFSIVNSPHYFLFGSAALVIGCSFIKVDRYESNSLINSDNYSRLMISEESFKRINPQIDKLFKYWLEAKEYSQKVIAVSNKSNSVYEIVLLSNFPKAYVSPISYKVGYGSIWSEIFK